MALHSMTGFARTQRSQGSWRLAWEIKSVNAKGLDLRGGEDKGRIYRLSGPGTTASEVALQQDLGRGLSAYGRIGSSFRVGNIDDIPSGEGRAFAVDGCQIAIFRRRDNSLRALGAAALANVQGSAESEQAASVPGMTPYPAARLWQVSGRNDVDYDTRVYLDTWYVKNWSLWHDMIILFKTVQVVCDRRGAF